MPEPYSEAQTRQQIIDQRLQLAGWDVDDPSQVIQELACASTSRLSSVLAPAFASRYQSVPCASPSR